MSRILVVDDKEAMRDGIGLMLSRAGHEPIVASDVESAVRLLRDRDPAVVVTDLQMPGGSGLDVLGKVRAHDETLPVIVMTAYGTVETAVEAMKSGAFDFVTKPFEPGAFVLTVKRAIEQAELRRENDVLRTQLDSAGEQSADRDARRRPRRRPRLVGRAPAMRNLRHEIERYAASRGTVLIHGESGTGKEVVARCIHAASPRADRPFLAVNCAALSETLLESELFGHEKGAFTGAERMRKGRFELANEGTLLLDEISEIAPSLQAKLLRVLQERTIERVGSSTSRRVDVRILATTNRDLAAEVRRGRFRQDLYFRLDVLPVRVPALRERIEDVPRLCRHLLGRIARREGRRPCRFDEAAMRLLVEYDWPGNVRELHNVCERACILAPDRTVGAEVIEAWLAPARRPTSTPPPTPEVVPAPVAAPATLGLGDAWRARPPVVPAPLPIVEMPAGSPRRLPHPHRRPLRPHPPHGPTRPFLRST